MKPEDIIEHNLRIQKTASELAQSYADFLLEEFKTPELINEMRESFGLSLSVKELVLHRIFSLIHQDALQLYSNLGGDAVAFSTALGATLRSFAVVLNERLDKFVYLANNSLDA